MVVHYFSDLTLHKRSEILENALRKSCFQIAPVCRRLPGSSQERADSSRHGGEALVSGQAQMKTIIDLLHDNRELELSKSEIEGHMVNIAASFFERSIPLVPIW